MKVSIRGSLGLMLFLAGFTIAPLQAPAESNARRTSSSAHRAQIDDYLARMAAFGFSSGVLVVDGGKTVVEKGYGFADRTKKTPITPQTAFNIGSLTKQFTAAAILRLEQDGRLSTADPITKYLPGVPPDKAGITIHQLLTQTGGIARQVVNPNKKLSRDETVSKILGAPLAEKPGGNFHYSNSGYQLLAAIIEHISGKPYEAYLRDTFFVPLAMSGTGTTQENRWLGRNVAAGYNEWKSLGTWSDWPGGWNDGTGNGNVVSTLDDLKKWMFALRDGRALAPTERDKLFQRYTSADDPGQYYGYGWYLVPSASGDVVYHGGDNPGYHSELRWNRVRNRIILVLTNAEFFDESGSGLALHKRIMATVIAKLLNGDHVDFPPNAVRLDAGSLHDLTGSYRLRDDSRLVVADESGALTLAADGQAAANLALQSNETESRRYAELDAKALQLLALMAANDRSGLKSALSASDDFYIDGWLSDWSDFRRDLGKFAGVADIASMALPWDPDLARTTAILQFERGTMDFQFSWKKDAMTETLDGRGLTHDVILPAAATSRNALSVYEPISRRTLHLEVRRRGRTRLLEILDASGKIVATAQAE